MLKTVIGSFPPKNLPLEEAMRWAIDIQLDHNLDIVTDGEQRTDMIRYFSSLPGLGMNQRGPFIKSKILPYAEPKKHSKLEDLRFIKAYLKSKRRDDVKAKVSITGPITLGFACACNRVEYYKGLTDHQIYHDFADALRPLIEEAVKNDCYVQIDEPSLSIRIMDPAQAVKIVNRTISGLPNHIRKEKRLIVHVCGSLTSSLFAELVKLETPILSLAFAAPNVRSNLDVVSKSLLVSNEKKIGVGCVSVQVRKREEVESFQQTVQRLQVLKEKLGGEQIFMLHPDCGMRPTGEEAVEPILDRLVSSAEYFQERK